MAASYEAAAALREALLGNSAEARHRATAALALSAGRISSPSGKTPTQTFPSSYLRKRNMRNCNEEMNGAATILFSSSTRAALRPANISDF